MNERTTLSKAGSLRSAQLFRAQGIQTVNPTECGLAARSAKHATIRSNDIHSKGAESLYKRAKEVVTMARNALKALPLR